MDRNIITVNDATLAREAAHRRIQAEKAARRELPEVLAQEGEPPPMDGGLDIDTKPDQWFQRLAKYVPSEAIGLYLALAGLVTADDTTKYGLTLLAALVAVAVAFNTFFLRRLWKVRRWSQIIVSDVALLVFVFATGGVLIQQLSFYGPRTATAVLVLTTAVLSFIDPPSDQSKPAVDPSPNAADGTI